jgi:hypothetical protein
MVAEHSHGRVKAELVLRQLREPRWASFSARLHKLQPHVLVIKVRPQLQQLRCQLALLFDVVQRNVPRRVQRLVFVREQLRRLLLQPEPRLG